jgi:Rieske 2Fe-2S family protein
MEALMRDDRWIGALLDERRPGHALPQAFYNDPDIFAFDCEKVFGASWLMVGFEAELPKPGTYLALTIARTPILIVRDRGGTVRGFFNSCRHRGAQICADGAGRASRLSCPYHQWTYELDGRLMKARVMGPDFDPSQHGLLPIHVEVVAGAIYVSIADRPPDFSAFRADLEAMLSPFRLAEAKLAHETVLVEKANWKLVMENARECYHCAACHPELAKAFPVEISDNFGADEGPRLDAFRRRMQANGLEIGPRDGPWWQCARFPLNEGAITFSMDGRPSVKKPLLDVDGGDIGSMRFAVEPHNFCHALGDYTFMFSAYPVSPEETHVVSKWLVHKDAVEGVDYTVEGLMEIWDVTNRQDRDLAENNQRGVNGRGYRPGPYSRTAEPLVLRFVDWYCAKVRSALGGPALRVAEVA